MTDKEKEYAEYKARFPERVASGEKILAKIAERDGGNHRSDGRWKRTFHAGATVEVGGVGGAASNSRGVVVGGLNKSAK